LFGMKDKTVLRWQFHDFDTFSPLRTYSECSKISKEEFNREPNVLTAATSFLSYSAPTTVVYKNWKRQKWVEVLSTSIQSKPFHTLDSEPWVLQLQSSYGKTHREITTPQAIVMIIVVRRAWYFWQAKNFSRPTHSALADLITMLSQS